MKVVGWDGREVFVYDVRRRCVEVCVGREGVVEIVGVKDGYVLVDGSGLEMCLVENGEWVVFRREEEDIVGVGVSGSVLSVVKENGDVVVFEVDEELIVERGRVSVGCFVKRAESVKSEDGVYIAAVCEGKVCFFLGEEKIGEFGINNKECEEFIEEFHGISIHSFVLEKEKVGVERTEEFSTFDEERAILGVGSKYGSNEIIVIFEDKISLYKSHSYLPNVEKKVYEILDLIDFKKCPFNEEFNLKIKENKRDELFIEILLKEMKKEFPPKNEDECENFLKSENEKLEILFYFLNFFDENLAEKFAMKNGFENKRLIKGLFYLDQNEIELATEELIKCSEFKFSNKILEKFIKENRFDQGYRLLICGLVPNEDEKTFELKLEILMRSGLFLKFIEFGLENKMKELNFIPFDSFEQGQLINFCSSSSNPKNQFIEAIQFYNARPLLNKVKIVEEIKSIIPECQKYLLNEKLFNEKVEDLNQEIVHTSSFQSIDLDLLSPVMEGDSLSSLKGDSLSSLKGDSLKVELNNSFNSVAVNSPVRTSSLTPIKSPILSPSSVLKSTSGETNLNLPITSPLKQYYLRQSPQTVQIPSRPKIPIPDEILSKKRRTSKLSIVSFPDDEESLKSTRKKFQSLKVQEITPVRRSPRFSRQKISLNEKDLESKSKLSFNTMEQNNKSNNVENKSKLSSNTIQSTVSGVWSIKHKSDDDVSKNKRTSPRIRNVNPKTTSRPPRKDRSKK
ncbi:hypothetical protein O9G_000170 [Rozella allomycis CSF55]|uniref:ELYS-like domain-containing protein n=1 Tax=Rozella allomycis (strain CSF55) TaxID=988480 RepID=A0A075ASK5_ROZAC|nr:hypothetical protein O9G_000170 [Rozella allomycis CSF55]|eukprot:EPZ31691.1 hypothetical protein O9G_000170 [Rozella allomycis CSF55]